MFYYLYQTKNNLNGKIYVGVHKTNNLYDEYMGSGLKLLNAVKKHGKKNFTKTILETFNNEELMFQKEREVVTDEFLKRTDVYNLRRGGDGGFGRYHVDRAIKARRRLVEERKEKYHKNPKVCKRCGDIISYEKKSTNVFCSKSCGATFNNNLRQPPSEQQRKRASKSLAGVAKTEEHKKEISKGRLRGIRERKKLIGSVYR